MKHDGNGTVALSRSERFVLTLAYLVLLAVNGWALITLIQHGERIAAIEARNLYSDTHRGVLP